MESYMWSLNIGRAGGWVEKRFIGNRQSRLFILKSSMSLPFGEFEQTAKLRTEYFRTEKKIELS